MKLNNRNKTNTMRNLAIALLCAMMSSYNATAQEAEISAGRPGMSTGVDVMPVGKIQWETGFGCERDNTSQVDMTTWTINTTQLRYGLSQYAELQLGFDIASAKADGIKESGMAPIVIGTKLKMYESESWLPTMGFEGTLTLATGKEAFRPEHAAPSMYLLFHHDLSDKWGLDYNVGAEWDGSTPQATIFTAINLGYSITDKVGVFVEDYNYMAKGEDASCNIDFGVTYVPHRRVQIDASANLNLNNISDYFMFGIGISWLIN